MENHSFARMLPSMALVAGLLALLGSGCILYQPARTTLHSAELVADEDAEQEPEYVEPAPKPYTGLTQDGIVNIWNVNKPYWRNSEDWERSMSSQYMTPWDGLVGGHH